MFLGICKPGALENNTLWKFRGQTGRTILHTCKCDVLAHVYYTQVAGESVKRFLKLYDGIVRMIKLVGAIARAKETTSSRDETDN